MPLSQYFISTLGWRGAYSALAVIYLVLLLPPILFLIRESPEEKGLGPDGQRPRRAPSEEALQAPPKESRASEGWTMREVLATREFWGIFLSRVFTPMGVFILLTHHVAYVVEVGFSPAYVTFLLGLSGLLAAPSMIGFGYLSDRIGRVLAVTITFLLFIAAAAVLLLIKDPSQGWLLYLYVIFFGLGFGGRGVIVSAMTADIFGGRRFPMIYGAMNLAFGIGSPLGPWLGGYIYDRAGSYQLAFMLSIVFMILAALFIFVAASGRGAVRRRT
ncbi:MAG: MFS transporter, partial [Nitrospinota bacterium]